MDPVTLLAAISAMMAAMQVWQLERDYNQTRRTYQRVYKEALQSPDIQSEARILATLLPQRVLDKLAARVERCWANFVSAAERSGAYPRQAEAELGECICEELRGIKRLNGTIPAGKLREWWNQYGCGPYIVQDF